MIAVHQDKLGNYKSITQPHISHMHSYSDSSYVIDMTLGLYEL